MKIVGILNLTPDSFSDGGKYDNEEKILSRVQEILPYISILDIGAESTRPNATILSAQEERERLEAILPKISKLCKEKNILLSLDSYHLENIQWGVESGFIDIINDVSGKIERFITLLIKHQETQIILMHSLTVPADKEIIVETENICEFLYHFFKEKLEFLEKSGIERNRVMIDPGIGFGKTSLQSWEIIDNFWKYREDLGTRIMIAHSRKSFLKESVTSS